MVSTRARTWPTSVEVVLESFLFTDGSVCDGMRFGRVSISWNEWFQSVPRW